jgi:tRNA-modifying protein YgfZ
MTGDAETVTDLRASLGGVEVARDVVRVNGPEAIGYLQGQLSQDVAALDVGASARSFVLQPTGKVDSWVRVSRTDEDEVLIDVDGGFGEALVARLGRFLLRTKAEITPLDWRCAALRGPGALQAALSAVADQDDAVALPAGWPGIEGADVLGPGAAVPAGVPAVNGTAYEAARLRSGVPAMGAELTERTIPAEVGQWVVDASVNFTKGCFTGQELVARIDSRGGNVPRHLRLLLAPTGEIPVDGAVVADGGEVGHVTSSAPAPGGGALGLALVGRGLTPPAAAEVRSGGHAVPVSIVDVPERA